MSESEIVRAERLEQNAGPEPRRRTGADEYDEGGGLINPTAWRLHRDIPDPADPWADMQVQCDRCEEIHERACTHGKDLCAECIWTCRDCNDEMADQQAYDDDRDEGIA